MRCCKELDIWFCCCKLGENKGFVLGGRLAASSGVGIGARFMGAAAGATTGFGVIVGAIGKFDIGAGF